MHVFGYSRFVLWITIPSTPVGRALTNFGGWWDWSEGDNPPMPAPMPTWSLGQPESPLAADALREARNDPASSVRHAAEWALDQLDLDESDHTGYHAPRPRPKPRAHL